MATFQPQKFGKYQLLDKIATGGMAELFRAKLTGAEGFEKLIAIKKILPHLSGEGELVKAFIDEAKLAALLQHENIVQIYDFGSMEGEYFIAMEYLFGKDLRTITQKASKRNMPLGLENILYMASRICAGLDYSHNLHDLQGRPLNIIHRDVNPQNIFNTYQGQVKIIDFGIAKAASHNTTTHEGLIKGKLAYMSPEQANGEVIDHRSDIFSLGIILYELLAEKRMFEGEALQIYPKVREARYKPPEEVITNVPAKLYDILHHALAKDREDRYQSCGDMLADLEECMYQLDSLPNARSFAQYIKLLFEEEFAAEELTLWAKTQVFSAGEDTSQQQSTETEEYGKTVVLPKLGPTEKQKNNIWRLAQKNNIWRLALALSFVIFSVAVDLNLKKIPFTKSYRDVSVYSMLTIAPQPPPEDEKIVLGKAALQEKRFDQAISIFEEVLAAHPSKHDRIADVYVLALQEKAAQILDNDQDGAKMLLLKALQFDSQSTPCLSQLGYIYVQRKDFQKAIDVYQKVADIEPQFAGAYFNLGYIFWETERYEKARSMYQHVVDLKPSFLDEALFNLAMVHAELGEQDKCLQNLEQAIAINPGNESARTYLQQHKEEAEQSDES
jgi:serine/threonine protein kinase/cytochrome c-type biogenesis protein CcmH/NrfG